MRKSKFSESQIVAVLQEAEAGVAVADVLRKHGISRGTYFKWKTKYGGASVPELRRLKELEQENAKLKRMYADLALENAAIKDVLSRKLYRRSRAGPSRRCSSRTMISRSCGPAGWPDSRERRGTARRRTGPRPISR